ncbi:putative calcium-transporting ATPase 13, plasma membrane-type [Cinnamomum micranthum f. kanehirae]|uniref:Calcium-transporting ATPase n=1 Tax=Cinnamomum micranthum f. kanehirae TaxID=337451 RepID=A0A443NEU5_9MAGN|nr:putative calcium-transporting ATPase 13, plasma membrane-type [Cinnamomum micranthum f. kanehirae]
MDTRSSVRQRRRQVPASDVDRESESAFENNIVKHHVKKIVSRLSKLKLSQAQIISWEKLSDKDKEQCKKLYYEGGLEADLDFAHGNEHPIFTFYRSIEGRKFLEFGGVKGIARLFKTNLEKGIHGKADDVTRRKAKFGLNAYPKPRTRSFFFFSLKAFKDHKILFLLVYAIFSLAFGIKNDGLKEGLSDGGRIFLVISLAATISAAREFCAELIMMSNMSSDINVRVMRHGSHQNMSISNVVVGDVVLLQTGDHIPAHGLLLNGDSLPVTYSSVAGHHQNVDYFNPYLSAGGKVVDGSCSMLVTLARMDTAWGRMISSSYCDFDFDEKTPLQVQLLNLTWWIRWIVLSISFLILGMMLVRYWMQNRGIDGNGKRKNEVMKSMLRIFTAAIIMPVMVIPEGWPIIVTLTFAYLRRTVMGNHALFRNCSALETMGAANNICTEKMDTLKVKVTKFCVGEEALTGGSDAIHIDVRFLLHQAVGISSSFAFSENSAAILLWATSELGMDMDKFKLFYTIHHVVCIDKRRQVTLRERNTINASDHVHLQGTAEMIVSMCSQYYTMEGIVEVINQERRSRFKETIQGMAAQQIQCIAFAHKHTARGQSNEVSGWTLLALVGLKIQCPSEPNARIPVEACVFAGVNVKLITRDDTYTAGLIATEYGILHANEDGAVVGGQEFRSYTDDRRRDMVDQIHVMPRSSRADKLLMVECLEKRGQIVAFIEGFYEDDLLTESYVRLLININTSGTRTVEKNSGIVILKDGFASIEKLLKCGRCIYRNARNFLQFQLTVFIVTVVVNCVTAVSTYKIEISAVQILWESLLLETIGSLALAAEHPTEELMLKGPVSLEETLITSIMWRNIISQALYQIILLLVLQFKSSSIFHVDGSVSDTLIFNTFVLCQVFNLFNSRNLEKRNMFEGIQDNRSFLWIVVMIVFLQVLMVELLYKFACIERLDWRLWAASVGMAAMSWPIALVVKGKPISNATEALQRLSLIFISFLERITVGTRTRNTQTHMV